MIKFLPLDLLGVSHGTPRKNENAIYYLQLSELFSEIFKFETLVKYANEITDDVIHSTQYHIKYKSRAISANLQLRSLKLGRPMVL